MAEEIKKATEEIEEAREAIALDDDEIEEVAGGAVEYQDLLRPIYE